jgi:hypothetical protein
MQQGIHERAPTVARGWMNDHPGGFVDDEETLVLVQHFYRYVLSDRSGRLGRRNIDDDHVVDLGQIAFLGSPVADTDAAGSDQCSDVGTRE